jgi:hypothetical protein
MHVLPQYPHDYIRAQVFAHRMPARPSPLYAKGDLLVIGASPSRLAVGTDGHVLTADSAQALGVKWAAAASAAWTSVVKAATTVRSATTVLADDPDLVIPMTGGKKYLIRGVIKYTMANATMDIKVALAYTGTMANHYRFFRSHIPGASAGTDMTTESQDNSLLGSTALLTTSATGFGQLSIDIIALPTTDGTWSFQWAQNTSDAGNLSVLVCSFLEYIERA